MIQRIQSIYLLVAVAACVSCAFLEQGHWIADNGASVASLSNKQFISDATTYQPWALLALLIVAGGLSLVAIFMFKNRMLQARLCIFSLLLLIGWYVAYGAFAFMLAPEGASFRPDFGAVLPFVGIVCTWLAWRGVLKDEFLIRSLDRLR